MAPAPATIPEETASDGSTIAPLYTGHVNDPAEPPTRVLSGASSRPGLKRSITTESRLSRITSAMPNPEADLAKGVNLRRPPGAGPPGAGGPPGGGGGGPPGLRKFSHGFFDPEFATFRGIAIKILGAVVVITTLVMWACAPFYWGSLWKSNHYIDKLAVRVIDRDGGAIGEAVSAGLLNMTGSKTQLHYFWTSPTEFPTITDIENDILDEGAWASIVINTGATAALAAARAAGDSTYLGTTAISVIYTQARQETAVGNYLVPYITAALAQVTAQLSAQNVAQFIAANSGNATALNLVAQAPTTLTAPISYAFENIRPFNQPVATAITLVGLIYMLIFAFITCMANNGVREIIAPFLTTRSYLMYRILAPLSLYAWLSLVFAMINLPFKVDFGAHFTYAGGFFLWWVILFLGMASVGLACEFMITVLGPKFIAFFLIPLIIANVSVVSLPHELQPWIYRYGVAMPFYNCSKAVRTIIFNTKNEIGQNVGILIGWVVLSIVTTTVATYLYRCKAVREHMREVGEQELDRKLPDGRIV